MSGAPIWIALTGTPGVGKTSLARLLRRKGVRVLDGNRLARNAGAIVGLDQRRDSKIVDPKRVARHLRRARRTGSPTLIDSHWAHEVPGLGAAIVLRLRPAMLRQRLARRGWSRSKIAENVEAEGLGVILAETAHRLPRRRVAELDVTGLTAARVARRLRPFLRNRDSRLTNLEIGRVDWTADFSQWSSTGTGASSTPS